MLIVTTAPDTARLCTLAQAQAEMPDSDADQVTVNTAIDHASAAIAAYCRRTFGQQVVAETIRLGHVRPSELMLGAVPPIVAITSLAEGSDAPLVQDTDFEVDTGAGLIYRLRGDFRCSWWATKVAITYVAGWILPEQANQTMTSGPTLPLDVQKAAAVYAATFTQALGRDPTVRSETLDNVGAFTYQGPVPGTLTVPSTVAALLWPYTRRPV